MRTGKPAQVPTYLRYVAPPPQTPPNPPNPPPHPTHTYHHHHHLHPRLHYKCRFDEDGELAAESPRQRVFLRGLPAPAGSHVRFDD